ncbi:MULTISPECIES: hypothetical protein [unclassified Pedobacter]|uniref:hypothetical protein n=1 Tax=unclassified Pedobacter TaxID=2628915 RepID=UPI001420500E|nr:MULTISPECIES: hypothetical protein [unclassified Pedobacter]NII81712.1 hypothetical protein [Pedobacter sp. SG908]NMN35716.1 hypothetical protein [Pedobacter sp. SG918]
MLLTEKHKQALIKELEEANECLQEAQKDIDTKNWTSEDSKASLEVWREVIWQRVKFIRENLERLDVYG